MTTLLHLVRAAVPAGASICILAGCANYSAIITDNEDDSFHLTVTGVSYTMSMPDLTNASQVKAEAYCATKDKTMQLVWLGRAWRPMEVEMCFRCVEPDADPIGPADFPRYPAPASSLSARR